ncbi:hypothetical protein ACHAXH_001856 [Discostella pseudostelligera]
MALREANTPESTLLRSHSSRSALSCMTSSCSSLCPGNDWNIVVSQFATADMRLDRPALMYSVIKPSVSLKLSLDLFPVWHLMPSYLLHIICAIIHFDVEKSAQGLANQFIFEWRTDNAANIVYFFRCHRESDIGYSRHYSITSTGNNLSLGYLH